MHVFYNASTATADYEAFLNKMHLWENELKSDQLLEEHQKYYAKYFIKIHQNAVVRFPIINQRLKRTKNMCAARLFSSLISNDIKDPIEALKGYRNKDVVEKDLII